MVNCVVFSFSDIGKNFRLLNHARQLSKQHSTHVYILGYDVSNVPLDVVHTANISIININKIDIVFPFIEIFLFPLIFFYHLLQFIGVMVSLPKVEFVFLTMHSLFLEPMIGRIIAKLFGCKLVIDVDSFLLTSDGSSRVRKTIETKMIGYGDVVLVPTQAKQMILRLRGIKSVLMRNIPVRSGPIVNRVDVLCEPIIGVITNEFEDAQALKLLKIIKHFDEKGKRIHFHLFGTTKSIGMIDSHFNKSNFQHCIVKYLSVNSKSFFESLQQCFVGLFINNNEVLNIPSNAFEMIGAGVPIVARRFGCISEIIKDKENGFLYDTEQDLLSLLENIVYDIDVVKMRREILKMYDEIIETHQEIFKKIIRNEEFSDQTTLFYFKTE